MQHVEVTFVVTAERLPHDPGMNGRTVPKNLWKSDIWFVGGHWKADPLQDVMTTIPLELSVQV